MAFRPTSTRMATSVSVYVAMDHMLWMGPVIRVTMEPQPALEVDSEMR